MPYLKLFDSRFNVVENYRDESVDKNNGAGRKEERTGVFTIKFKYLIFIAKKTSLSTLYLSFFFHFFYIISPTDLLFNLSLDWKIKFQPVVVFSSNL